MANQISEIKGIKFYYREGFSDLKTFEEVIGRDIYQKKGNRIEAGEKWMDCGGNVGAFALLACSKGAEVTVYEPDPFNCKMIEQNLKLNNYDANIKQVALVHNDVKEANLYIGNNNNVWRNSLMKNWCGKGIKVDCVSFDEEAEDFDCCKMDIEGAEMPILESTEKVFKKLVYEWSFDIDPSLVRFWNLIEKQSERYKTIANLGNAARIKTRDFNVWQKSWFPACVNVFCYDE